MLHARGASVVVLDWLGSNGGAVAADIGAAFHPVDVTDFACTEHALQDAVDALGDCTSRLSSGPDLFERSGIVTD